MGKALVATAAQPAAHGASPQPIVPLSLLTDTRRYRGDSAAAAPPGFGTLRNVLTSHTTVCPPGLVSHLNLVVFMLIGGDGNVGGHVQASCGPAEGPLW